MFRYFIYYYIFQSGSIENFILLKYFVNIL